MITPSFALTATERVLPRLALDFTTASLDSRVTFTRTGTTATRVNNSGYVEVMAADTPRFDFDPITLVCKGLLIEEARTNLRSYSEEFNNPVWVTSNSSVSANFAGITSPSGAQTADKLILNNGSTTGHVVSSLSLTSGTTYTYSCYAKAGERNVVRLRIIGTAGWASAVVNLSTGAVVSNVGTIVVSNAGGGWYRIAVTAACDLTGTNAVYVYDNTGTAGNGTDGLYIWGAQLEAGAFATSYIPTTTTALTRNSDIATMTGTNFSDWFNASEGAFAVTAWPAPLPDLGISTTGALLCAASLGNALTAQVSLLFRTEASSRVNRGAMYVRDASGATPVETAANETYPNNTYTKAVAALKSNEWAFAANGSAVATAATQTLPAVTQMNIGTSYNGVGVLNGWVKEILYYPQRLTNAEVQAFSKG